MEQIETIRTLDPHTITHGIVCVVAAGLVAIAALVTLFRSF